MKAEDIALLVGVLLLVLAVGGWFGDRWDAAHRDARNRNR